MMRQLTRFNVRTLIYFLVIALAFLILAAIQANAQTTTATATVVDQAGTTWANGTFKFDFVPNPNYNTSNINCNGVPFPSAQWTISGILDNAGHFSQAGINSNNFCTPSGSTYTLTVCPNATSACSVIKTLTIQGATIDFSSTITSQTPAPNVKPLPLARAYNDFEVAVSPTQVGYFYQNVTTNFPRYWNGVSWQNFGSGVVSFTAGNLSPLFTTSIGSDPLNPNLQFTATNAAALQVYANCTGTSNKPTFCPIGANMLPVTITSNTTGLAAGISGTLTPCGTTLFAKGILFNGNPVCVQPAFTDLAGNISTSQMNSGTNADASHVFIGGNSGLGQWAPFSTITGTGHNYYFNFTGCTITNSSNLNNCGGTITWSSVGLGSATVVGSDFLTCTVGTGNTYTASFSLGTGGITSTNFTYFWTEIMANSSTSSTPTMLCHLHTAA